MGNLWVNETYVNDTEGHGLGDSEWYETFTPDLGTLYRSIRKEYGGTVATMYRDNPEGPPVKVGWVFFKRVKYEDVAETYLRAVWVEVSTVPVEKVTTTTPVKSPWAPPAYDDPNRDRSTTPMEGDRTACRVCDMDIEYHGKGSGWIGRGGDSLCSDSGASGPLPRTRHKPYSDRGTV